MLGVDASLVTGYDLEELTSAHRTCVFGAAAAARPATKYSSQLVKLWSIFFDIVRRRRHWSLVFEDAAEGEEAAARHLNISMTMQTRLLDWTLTNHNGQTTRRTAAVQAWATHRCS